MSIYDEILAERCKQDAHWGVQEHLPPVWITILGEEFGEAASGILKQKETDRDSYRFELIQVAAVAVAAIEAFDRQHPKAKPRFECTCNMFKAQSTCWHTGYQPTFKQEVGTVRPSPGEYAISWPEDD